MFRKIIKSLGFTPNKNQSLVSIHISSTAVRFIQLTASQLVDRQTFAYTDGNWQRELGNALAAVPGKSQLALVLAPEYYSLVQFDKPTLAEDEILQALPWQIKELVTVAPEDMVLDYIELPFSAQQQPKINIVVCSKSWLSELVALCDKKKGTLLSIQPEEWLLQKLVPAVPQATMLVSHQPEQELLIQIVRDGLLYFSRRTRGFNRIHLASEDELRQGMFDRLVLELQRSMDYFESQLKQPPVRDIQLIMAQPELIAQMLRENGFSQVQPLQLPDSMAMLPAAEVQSYWPALAAAISLTAESQS